MNDRPEGCAPGPIHAAVEASDGQRFPLLVWESDTLAANTNLAGPRLRWILPRLPGTHFTLVLETPGTPDAASRYQLHYRPKPLAPTVVSRTMNLD